MYRIFFLNMKTLATFRLYSGFDLHCIFARFSQSMDLTVPSTSNSMESLPILFTFYYNNNWLTEG